MKSILCFTEKKSFSLRCSY